MQLDGKKIQDFRAKKGLTQAMLANKAGWDRRTIQRAEKGEPVRNVVAAQVAEVLEVRLDQIQNKQQDLFEDAQQLKAGIDQVVLLPTKSGRRLVDTLSQCTFAVLEKAVEPTRDNIDWLENFATVFEQAWQNPWIPYEQQVSYSEADILRLMASANTVIEELNHIGISVFLGTYQVLHQKIHYNEFGEVYVRTNSYADTQYPKAIVVLSDEPVDRLIRSPEDHMNRDIPF